MNTLQCILKAQFVKNLLGAAGGVMVAMVVYGAYHVSASFVAALASPSAPMYTESVIRTDTESYSKFVERVKEARSSN